MVKICFARAIAVVRTGCDKGRVWSEFIKVIKVNWNETQLNMVLCYRMDRSSAQSACRDGERERAGKTIGLYQILDLILTQRRTFEEIKTCVTF